jgi:protein-disulfide isomerase
MNTKRILFWGGFIIVLALIIWGLVAAMNKPAPGDTTGTPAPLMADDHVRGPADAPATLIEYGDFQCPSCENFYPYVEQAVIESSSTLKYVYRQFPLIQAHPNALPAAMASEAAGAQGKFWEMYHLLFENHIDWTDLPNATNKFVEYATTLGLNIERFKADLGSSTLRDRIQRDQDDGIKIGVQGTPSFFLNGKIMKPASYDEFKALIKTAATSSSK